MGSTTKSDASTSQQPAFDYIFFGRPFLPRVRQGDISTNFTAWMSKPFFCKNPCLESRGYFNATMLLCYQCKNILIFGSNHKTSLCCKTETVQVADTRECSLDTRVLVPCPGVEVWGPGCAEGWCRRQWKTWRHCRSEKPEKIAGASRPLAARLEARLV